MEGAHRIGFPDPSAIALAGAGSFHRAPKPALWVSAAAARIGSDLGSI